jgi:hypothetical protein
MTYSNLKATSSSAATHYGHKLAARNETLADKATV